MKQGRKAFRNATSRHVLATAGLTLLAVLPSGPASAQDETSHKPAATTPHRKPTQLKPSASTPASVQVEDVNVTASRTGRTNIQNLPMAVTALNPNTLNTLGLTGMEQITRLAPSVSMISEGPGISSITIRGLAVRGIDSSETEDRPLVTTYLDDTPLSVKSSNPDLKVIDLEDVEVLRGPQGTLYGAGSMAGTIRLVTQKPDSQKLYGYVETSGSGTAGYGGFNDTGRFMVNIPLVKDQLAVRISGYHDDYSGYIKDVATGPREVATGATSNPESNNQGRVALRWTPTEKLTVDLSLTSDVLHGGLDFANAGLPQYQTSSATQSQSTQNLTLIALAMHYDFAHVTLSSSTSYTHFRTRYDEDETATDAYYNFDNEGPQEPARFVARNTIDDVVQEVRLTSRNTGPLKLTAGVFYETGTRDTTEENPTTGLDAFYGPSIGIPNYSSATNDLAFEANDSYTGRIQTNNRQVAVFTEGTYTFFDKLNVTAGIRFFDWSERYNIDATGLEGTLVPASSTMPVGVATTQAASAAASGTTPRFALLYHVDSDINLWSEVAKGFRYGGANQPIPLSYCGADLAAQGLTKGPPSFGPDKLWSYSVGEKSRLFDRRMTFNLTAFWIDWKNTQTTNYLDCSYYYTRNIGSVVSRGIELDSTIRIARGLRLLVNGSYNDAYNSSPIPNLNAPVGTRLPFAPVYLASLTATYDHDLAGRDLQFSLNYSYKGSFNNGFDHTDNSFRVIPESNSLNAALTYHLPHTEVSVFADNITNEASIYAVNAQPSGTFQPGDDIAVARPRTIGLRLRGSF